MKKRVPFALRRSAAVLATCALPTAFAQTATLGETVVTATRVETRADDLVSDVRVIDRSRIEASTARTLPELLTREAGVQFSSYGGAGQFASVFVRGTDSRHSILLVDGVRYSNAAASTPIWETLPIESIERIEVLQGPASALYGADALGGVIQVFTRKGREGFHPTASLTAGSYGHVRAATGLQGGQGPWRYAMGVERLQEKGFSATNPKDTWDYDPDRDGIRQDAVHGSVAYELNAQWRLDGALLHSDGVVRSDDGAGVDTRTRLRATIAQAGVKGQLSANLGTELRLSQSQDTNRTLAANYPNDMKTVQSQLTWQNTIDTAAGLVVAGLDHRAQKLDTPSDYAVKQRTINGAFAGVNGQHGASTWQLNLRHDSNSQFGGATTGLAGYGLRLSPAWRLNASVGTTFAAPTFDLLYSQFMGGIYSNANLRPEHGRNHELGATWTQGRHEVRAVYFDNRVTDLISTGLNPQNVGRARLEGTTLGWKASLGALNVRASLDLLDPRNEVSGKQLAMRAKQQGTLGADWREGAWRFGSSLLHVGHRFSDSGNTVALGAFNTIDTYAQWQVTPETSLQAKVNNVFNKQYELVNGFNQPGRALYLTARWQPK